MAFASQTVGIRQVSWFFEVDHAKRIEHQNQARNMVKHGFRLLMCFDGTGV